ncbi:WbqC-like protein [Candidatus Thiomargarita nelsonii]|uniref:WbqC-like protein n=1 Tax=Candidatus Thiomargarita nelsonii TaxID=1003181 RepID=A0A0A6PCS2_9GAMM|nr:WbqC-like protein [Candidatus Thiomargarita nelsonii]
MKLAIMQPYLFPYLGYFQLISAVDRFVFYDDVNFIKGGWINRNRLFLSGGIRYITIPLSKASPFLKINEVVVQEHNLWRRKMLESVRQSYSKAPYFTSVYNIFREVLFADEKKIATIAKLSVISVSEYLELKVRFVNSSSCYNNSNLTGMERVLDICRLENADDYYNLSGGRLLYDDKIFKLNNINLNFVEPHLKLYAQFSDKFYPGLSIIDVLMFNDVNAVREMLNAEESF